MKSYKLTRLLLLFAVTLVFVSQSVYIFAEGEDLGWPREVEAENAKILIL